MYTVSFPIYLDDIDGFELRKDTLYCIMIDSSVVMVEAGTIQEAIPAILVWNDGIKVLAVVAI